VLVGASLWIAYYTWGIEDPEELPLSKEKWLITTSLRYMVWFAGARGSIVSDCDRPAFIGWNEE